MDITQHGEKVFNTIAFEVKARGYQASNEMRNAALLVLRGQRSGRRYRVPFTGHGFTGPKKTPRKPRYYTASAPGEAPAVRTGVLRMSWVARPRAQHTPHGVSVYPGIYTNVPYAKMLEEGTKKGMAPRPYAEAIKKRAMPAIERIYSAPYNI